MAEQNTGGYREKEQHQRQQSTEGARANPGADRGAQPKSVSKGENAGGENIEQETQHDKKQEAVRGS